MSVKVNHLLHTLSKHKGPQYTNRFKVRLPVFNIPLIQKALGHEDANGDELNVLCTSVKIPEINLQQALAREHGPRSPINMTSGFDIGKADFTFIDTQNGLVRTYLETWTDSLIDQYGRIAHYDDIKRNIYVDALDREGKNTLTVKLIDCVPTLRQSYNFSNEVGKPLEINATFQVANYEITTANENKFDKNLRKVRSAIGIARELGLF